MRRARKVIHKQSDELEGKQVWTGKKDDSDRADIRSCSESNPEGRQPTEGTTQMTLTDEARALLFSIAPVLSRRVTRLPPRRSMMLRSKRILQLREKRGENRQNRIVEGDKCDTNTQEEDKHEIKNVLETSHESSKDYAPYRRNPTKRLGESIWPNMKMQSRRAFQALTPLRFRWDPSVDSIKSRLVPKGELNKVLGSMGGEEKTK